MLFGRHGNYPGVKHLKWHCFFCFSYLLGIWLEQDFLVQALRLICFTCIIHSGVYTGCLGRREGQTILRTGGIVRRVRVNPLGSSGRRFPPPCVVGKEFWMFTLFVERDHRYISVISGREAFHISSQIVPGQWPHFPGGSRLPRREQRDIT